MPDDGGNTEIEVNNIGSHGSQRWCITFADALYSGAASLIFSNTFSAVDAHVNGSIFGNALNDELGSGRTWILITRISLYRLKAYR